YSVDAIKRVQPTYNAGVAAVDLADRAGILLDRAKGFAWMSKRAFQQHPEQLAELKAVKNVFDTDSKNLNQDLKALQDRKKTVTDQKDRLEQKATLSDSDKAKLESLDRDLAVIATDSNKIKGQLDAIAKNSDKVGIDGVFATIEKYVGKGSGGDDGGKDSDG